MPFDGVFTSSIVHELSSLINSRIDKVQQPSKDEMVLLFKKDKKQVKMLFCSNAAYPRVQLTETNRENPKAAPTFCMILRKYLVGGRIAEVNQVNFDRIIEIKIECKDELGYQKDFYLVTEIMGKHSNIILLDDNKKIVDSIKHINSDINRYRIVLPGAKYISPPSADKTNPLLLTREGLEEIYINNPDLTAAKVITEKFFGLCKIFANEVCGNLSSKKSKDLSQIDRDTIINSFFSFIEKIKNKDYENTIYLKNEDMFDFYPFKLKQYNELEFIDFKDPSSILDIFFSERAAKNVLKQKYHDLFKLVTNLIDRTAKKIQIHNDKLVECSDLDKWKLYGDLLMANQYLAKPEMETIEVQNFYDENLSNITIPLDKELNIIANAQRYYKKYNKEKNTIEYVNKQLADAKEEMLYLETIIYNLESAQDVAIIEEIKIELSALGYIKKKNKGQKIEKSQPHHFRSSDGYDIYVGKNNNQNDFLTTKFAIASDIWMHTKNIPGSHVIIKSQNGYVTENTLIEGAMLAAYYSKAKDSASVPIDYTEKKNVKKPSGSKPGMVIYYTNKTIYVTPEEEAVKKLKKA